MLNDEMQTLYAKLPKADPAKCEAARRTGRCYNCECCTVTGCSPRERHNINRYLKEKNLGLPFVAMQFGAGYILPNTCGLKQFDFQHYDVRCEYLRDGRCAIYEVRPAICRLFGACEELACSYFPEEAKTSVMQKELETLGLFPEGFFKKNSENIKSEFRTFMKGWNARAQQKINKLIHKKYG